MVLVVPAALASPVSCLVSAASVLVLIGASVVLGVIHWMHEFEVCRQIGPRTAQSDHFHA